MLDKLVINSGLGMNDHQVLLFDFYCCIELNDTKTKKYNFFIGRYVASSYELSTCNWEDLFRGLCLTISWDCFTDKLVKLLEKSVPESKAPTRLGNHNPFETSTVLKAIKYKRKKWL